MNQEENELSVIALAEDQKLRRKNFLAESELEKLSRQEKKKIAQKKEVLAKLRDRSKILQERLLEFKAKEEDNQSCSEHFYEEISNLEESKAHLENLETQYTKVKKTEAELKKRRELSKTKFIEERHRLNSLGGETKFEHQFDQLVKNFNSLRGENLKARIKLEEIISKNDKVKERVINAEILLKNEKKRKEKLIEKASSLLVEREENMEKQKVFEERLRIILTKHNKETEEANSKKVKEKMQKEYVSVKKKLRGKYHRSENEKEVKAADYDSSKWDEFFKRSEGKSIFQIRTLVKSVMNDNVALFQNLGQFNREIQYRRSNSKNCAEMETNGIFLHENMGEGGEEHDNDTFKYLKDVCQLLEISENLVDNEALVISKIIDRVDELIAEPFD